MAHSIQPSSDLITVQEQMKRLFAPLKATISEAAPLPLDLCGIISQYSIDEDLTNWFTALERTKLLPQGKRIVPLPKNIHETLECELPPHKNFKKPDGTCYKIKEMGVLYLIPPHPIAELIKNEKVYWKDRIFTRNDVFPFSFATEEMALFFKSATYRWVWITKDVLLTSIGPERECNLIENLSAQCGVKFEMPSLEDALPIQLLHRAATGESLYRAIFSSRWEIPFYTYLQESWEGFGHYILAGSAEGHLTVTLASETYPESCGFGLVCKDLNALAHPYFERFNPTKDREAV